MKLSFHGADREVTGSCHLLECGGKRVLVDCGMYQGARELDEENAEPFGFEPRDVDFLLLTHAHLDHCGRLPLLVKRGFRGEVIATAASHELARLVLLDAAHLQEEEAIHRLHHLGREREGPGHATPLYETLDALNSLERFGRSAAYGSPIDLAPGLRATFLDAGHILGSASVLLELREGAKTRRLLFSGDLGNAGRPLLRAPVAREADDVVMETTYGDRKHKSLARSIEELYGAAEEAFGRGGNVIIPTFALERSQEILYFLREGVQRRRLVGLRHVFLDSPMAISATAIFERHPEGYNESALELFREGRDPFQVPGLRFCRELAESKAVNEIKSGAIIMAGSGMCAGGRVRHHLARNLGREECAVVFVGYADRGTLARTIIDGARWARLFGREVPVRAKIHTIGGFSAHADQEELLGWHAKIGAGRTFLVHGEEAPMRLMAQRLKGTRVEMPELHQSYEF